MFALRFYFLLGFLRRDLRSLSFLRLLSYLLQSLRIAFTEACEISFLGGFSMNFFPVFRERRDGG